MNEIATPCSHSRSDSPMRRLAFLVSLRGVVCGECGEKVRADAKTRIRAVGLCLVLPVVLGVLWQSVLAGVMSGMIISLVLIMSSHEAGIAS